MVACESNPIHQTGQLRATFCAVATETPLNDFASRKSQDIVIQRHLAAARTRPRGRGKGQLSVGPQTQVPVPERVGDLAQELEAVEDERQAVAEEKAPDLDLHVEVWRGR